MINTISSVMGSPLLFFAFLFSSVRTSSYGRGKEIWGGVRVGSGVVEVSCIFLLTGILNALMTRIVIVALVILAF